MNKKKLLNCQHVYTYNAPHPNLEMTISPSIRSSQKRSNLENSNLICYIFQVGQSTIPSKAWRILALIVHVFVSGVTLLQ